MRRAVRTLAAAVLTGATLAVAAACGSSSSSVSMAPASDPAGNPSRGPGPIADANVTVLSATAAGGREARVATALNSGADIVRFVRQFRMPAMRNRIRDAIGDELKAPDHDIVGQVVTVGCDRPRGVDVMAGQDGRVRLVPHQVASPLQECLVPVTTVAIAVLPRN
jgi:hypothetical protein